MINHYDGGWCGGQAVDSAGQVVTARELLLLQKKERRFAFGRQQAVKKVRLQVASALVVVFVRSRGARHPVLVFLWQDRSLGFCVASPMIFEGPQDACARASQQFSTFAKATAIFVADYFLYFLHHLQFLGKSDER